MIPPREMHMTHMKLWHPLIFIIIAVWVPLPPCLAGTTKSAFLLADHRGKIISSKNATIKMIPASTLKIFTGLVALESLGAEYRPQTWFFYDRKSGDLSLKGFGNPLFISEEIKLLTQIILKKESPVHVRDIILDHSFFSSKIHIPGTQNSLNPYDATTGALCANFNTISFTWDTKGRNFISAEPQTPLIDLFQKQIRQTGLTKGRILLPPGQRDIYAGLLIKAFLREEGVKANGIVKTGKFIAPIEKKSVIYSGFTMSDMVTKLLYYSNNYIANQLMLIMGAHQFGPPANLEKGARYLNQFATESLKLDDFRIVEASGLSRRNHLSPSQMLVVLKAFTPYYKLLRRKGNDFYKTGTLHDVRTRAGYLLGNDKKLYPYVIMLNHTRRGYNDILKALKRKVRAASTGGNSESD